MNESCHTQFFWYDVGFFMEHWALWIEEYMDFLIEYRVDMMECRAHLRADRALFMKYKAFLMEHRALLMKYRALLMECRAFLKKYRAFLMECRALLMKYTALLIECRALLETCLSCRLSAWISFCAAVSWDVPLLLPLCVFRVYICICKYTYMYIPLCVYLW